MIARACSFLVCLALAGAAQAASDKPKPKPESKSETAPAPAPKKDVEPVSNDPQMTTATFGDWVERCQRISANGETSRICEVAQTITATGQTAPLAEIAIGRVKKSDPLRMTLVLPVNVGFPSTPRIALDAADPLELAWRQCVPAGCFADATFGVEAQRAWREAKSAKVESKAAGGRAFNFAISLSGLPQALDAMAKEP